MCTTHTNGAGDALLERSAAVVGNGHERLLVEALYPYSYEMQPGRNVSFEAGDCFILVEKSNEDWWHVRKGEQDIYVPANYMRESHIDFDEEEQTDSLNSQGDSYTLSPSSEDSCYAISDETQDSEEPGVAITTSSRKNSERIYVNIHDPSERIYANIPAVSTPRERSKRHKSAGAELDDQNAQRGGSFRPKSASLPSGWSVELDDSSGREYYFNSETNETSWKPPSDIVTAAHGGEDALRHSLSLPRGWRLERQTACDECFYVNESNNEMWQSSKDENGRTYYYNCNRTETLWELPAYNESSQLSVPNESHNPKLIPRQRMLSEGSEHVVNLRHKSPQLHLRSSKSTSMISGLASSSMNSSTEMSSFIKGHQRNSSADLMRNSLILSDEFSTPSTFPVLDYSIKKEGTINRKKLCEKGGKKVKKMSWGTCYVKLSAANMIMFKNQSAAQARPGFVYGQPESSCDLRGARIEKMPDEKNRRNIVQVATVAKLCFLLQVDDPHEFSVWYSTILEVVRHLEDTEPVEQGMQAKLYGDIVIRPGISRSLSTGPSRGSLKKIRDGDKKNIRDKLKKLITRRPTIEELHKKGIIKDTTFGCHIVKLCLREQTKVPKVVVGCIEAIEAKGLHFDGLYRISGNVSSIQQLRITVDQEENVSFGERPFDDVHVLTGTLKLYFRELPEPLIPYDFYDDFIAAIKSSSKHLKMSGLQRLVTKLPTPNNETLRFLFRHLKRVMENSHQNRMHAHNIAIVFGPTLLAPREEHGNIAVNTVYQNQIVEFILLEYDHVLGKDS